MAKEFLGQEYAVATNNKGLQQETRLQRVIARVSLVFSTLVVLGSLAMVAFCMLVFLSPISGTSMMTTLNATGENTDTGVVFRLGTPQRGDIIITKLYCQDTNEQFTKERYPNKDSRGYYNNIIKRVIALGGDKITMTRTVIEERFESGPAALPDKFQDYNYLYTIYINGVELQEDYLDEKIGSHNATNFYQLWRILNGSKYAITEHWKATNLADCVQDGVLTIPEGYWFFMGDNRGGDYEYARSFDCTELGPQPQEYCLGVCVDVVNTETNMPAYVWDKIVYYLFFGWAWRK